MTSQPIDIDYELEIPAEDLTEIENAFQTIETKLLTRLKELGPAQRRGMTKMGSKSVDFVSKTLVYAQTNPELTPSFVDPAAFAQHLQAFGLLRGFEQRLHRAHDMVEDTQLLMGAKANAEGLAFYRAAQAAAKMNRPGAAVIVADLAPRFAGQGKNVKTEEPAAESAALAK